MLAIAKYATVAVVAGGVAVTGWQIVAAMQDRPVPVYGLRDRLAEMAKAGRPSDATVLAILLYSGIGGPRDPKAAAEWFRRGAEAGDPLAQLNMGKLYLRGDGVKEDLALARRWLRKAADQKAPEAFYLLGRMAAEGLGGTADKAAAIALYESGYRHQDPRSTMQLSAAYLKGDGVGLDPAYAMRLLREAAQMPDSSSAAAARELAGRFLEGIYVPKSETEAVKWLKLAAERGSPEAAHRLGMSYLRGEMTLTASPSLAHRWLSQSAIWGDKEAQFRLGQLLVEDGRGAEGLGWLLRLAYTVPTNIYGVQAGDAAAGVLRELPRSALAAYIAELHMRAYPEEK